MRFRVAILILVLIASACSGDDAGSDTTEAPVTEAAETAQTVTTTSPVTDEISAPDAAPWGLDSTAMPDTQEAVAAVFAALPGEIGGLARTDAPGRFEGAIAVEYGGEALTIRATPMESVSTQIGSELTALEWLEMMAGGMEGNVEGVALEANSPVAWIASAEEVNDGTMYVAIWCDPDGLWYFDVVAEDAEARLELVQSFIAAVAQM